PAAKDAVPPAASDAVPPASDATTVVDESVSFRWYPVVDYDRCTNCLECLNFCLFGVFGVDASGGLLVEQPDACRDGCPACARVCPSGAIMFPRHDDRAMAGDPKAPVGGGGGLVQLLGDLNSMDTAATERDHAVAEKAGAEEDDLDQLVDDLDEMDL
ncbi:MAG: ferredoxin family protein, partial [Candidatus Nealsonbacteria bacterium]|nr:ferredoxin family protein [Candidatus Nealsonbacteria bacterium]